VVYDASHMYENLGLLHEGSEGEEEKIEVEMRGGVVEKYIILDDLGCGATALVKHGKCKSTGVQVAIKCITEETNTGRAISGSWKNTAKNLMNCAAPTVVKMEEVFEEENGIFIVLELCAGTLVNILRKTDHIWTQKTACHTVYQILRAAETVHARGLVHGDFTPGNILSVDQSGSFVKLSGFTKVTAENLEDDLLCEPQFKAPEVLERKKHGKAVDMWSIGCLTYLFLSGKLPFEDTNLMRLNVNIKNGTFKFPVEDWADIDLIAQDFISNLLKKEASERLTAEQALQHQWILNGGSDVPIKHFQANLRANKSVQ